MEGLDLLKKKKKMEGLDEGMLYFYCGDGYR